MLKIIYIITIPTLLYVSYDQGNHDIRIYSSVKIDAIKIYVILYHIIKLIMLRNHLKHSSNEKWRLHRSLQMQIVNNEQRSSYLQNIVLYKIYNSRPLIF